jgi:hypothetical protein
MTVTLGSLLSITDVTTNETTTKGGVLYIGTCSGGVYFTGVNVTNTFSQIGGLLYISSCPFISIVNIYAINSQSRDGPGGAIFFGSETSFEVGVSNFENCTSFNGNGGAIACNSTFVGNRIIRNCEFLNSVGGSDNKGNDYADINPDASLISLYKTTSIESITSSSEHIKFYFQSLDASLDCIIEDYCNTNETYVGSEGKDSLLCGIIADFPCETLEYTISSRITPNAFVHVLNGRHALLEHNFILWGDFELVVEGETNNTSNVGYPVIYPDGSVGKQWIHLFTFNKQEINFKRLKFVFPRNSSLSGPWFKTTMDTHVFRFEECYFTVNDTYGSFLVPSPIFTAELGVLLFVCVRVRDGKKNRNKKKKKERQTKNKEREEETLMCIYECICKFFISLQFFH